MMKAWMLLLSVMLLAGCEVDTRTEGVADADNNSGSGPQTPTDPPTDPDSPTNAGSVAQAEWDSIDWHTKSGPSCKGAVKVMDLTAKISSDGSKVNFTWDRYPWRDMGLGHFFVWNGSGWSGGKFDWIRTGGQGVKLLENVREGYNGLRAPSSGTRVAFAWTSSDGDERSNLAYTVWP